MQTICCSFRRGLTPHSQMSNQEMRTLKKGRLNELRVRTAVKAEKPWWYVAGRWADEEEDKRGIDLWILHKTMGWVPFQVKSSLSGFNSHERQGYWFEKNGGSRVPCIISNRYMELSDIVSQLEVGFRFERIKGSFSKKRKAYRKLKR